MSETDKVVLTEAEALGLYRKNQKQVHTILNGIPNVLVGADWDMGEFRTAVRKALKIEIGGEQCRRMGHGLVIWRDKTDPVFCEVDDKKLGKLEAKKISDNH